MRNIALIDVDRLSTSILEYVSIGSDLLAAAFVFDITGVIVFITSPTVDRAALGRPLIAFSVHLITLLLIVFVQSGERTRWKKEKLSNIATILAFVLNVGVFLYYTPFMIEEVGLWYPFLAFGIAIGYLILAARPHLAEVRAWKQAVTSLIIRHARARSDEHAKEKLGLEEVENATGESGATLVREQSTPYLPKSFREEGLREALDMVQAIDDAQWRARVLADLAPKLSEPLLREALATARVIENAQWLAEALAGLVPHLPASLLGEALDIARAIENAYWRAEALSMLAPHFPEPLKVEVMQEALGTARALGSEDERSKALVGLAPRLAELGYPEEALDIARAIENAYWRAEALRMLAPHLPKPLLREALTAVRTIDRD